MQSSHEESSNNKERNRRLGGFVLAFVGVCIAIPLSGFIWVSMATVFGSTTIMTSIMLILLLAGIFPLSALAYYKYRKSQHLEQLRFDFKLLGIDATSGHSDTLGGNVVSRYEQLYNADNFAIQSMLCFVVVVLAIVALFGDVNSIIVNRLGETALPALQYGFVGSYIFSIRLVYRRYTTFDLQPYVYFNCALTFLSGIAFNFVLFEVIFQIASNPLEAVSGVGAIGVGVIAFSFGYFPSLAIGFIETSVYHALRLGNRRASRLPLKLIDGISIFDEVRLRDEGIDNIQNLATVRIDELLLSTRFSVQQVVEWVDQATLYSYLGDMGKQEDVNRLIDQLTALGIRGVSDLRDQWIPSYEIDPPWLLNSDGFILHNNLNRVAESDRASLWQELRRSLPAITDGTNNVGDLDTHNITVQRLDAMYRATRYGPNMAYIHNYWRTMGQLISDLQRPLVLSVQEQARGAFSQIANEQSSHSAKQAYKTLPDNVREIVKQEAEQRVQQLEEDNASATQSDVARLSETGVQEYLGLARIEYAEGHIEEAKRFYNLAIQANGQNAAAHNELAWLLLTEYRDDKDHCHTARTHAQTAVQISKDKPTKDKAAYLDTLAGVHLVMAEHANDLQQKQDHLTEARNLLEQVLDPDVFESIPDYGKVEVKEHETLLLTLEAELKEMTDDIG